MTRAVATNGGPAYDTLEWADWFNNRRLLSRLETSRRQRPKPTSMRPKRNRSCPRDLTPGTPRDSRCGSEHPPCHLIGSCLLCTAHAQTTISALILWRHLRRRTPRLSNSSCGHCRWRQESAVSSSIGLLGVRPGPQRLGVMCKGHLVGFRLPSRLVDVCTAPTGALSTWNRTSFFSAYRSLI